MSRRMIWMHAVLGLALFTAAPVWAQEETEDEQEKTENKEDKVEKKKKDSYKKFLAEDVIREEGLFDLVVIGDEYYFEISDEMLGRDMLLGERVAQLSSSSKVAAGEMRKAPILIRFTRDDKNVYLHKIVSSYDADSNDPVSLAVNRTSIDPILHSFSIEALNPDSTAAVIEVTDFYSEEIKEISPFNSKYKAGKLEKAPTHITEALAFPENMEVRTYMSYSNTKGDPFSIIVHRSLLLLPEEPMMPRYEDPRMGYFSNSKTWFSTDTVGVSSLKFINRFDLRPRQEEMEDYYAGKMVEPEKPIVFYIDDAFPDQWKEYIKAGIEDWQAPFEAIGFKNAILAREYPKDDPTFHPEDIRYSCVRYISLPKANSMGPRWVDPRSGEVIGGDVLWWHNVVELLRDWRFVQTAAADPRARKRNPDLDVLGPMIRYVAAHELGHVLGLKHNMRASYAFPTDSLRSPTFTEKHGTTPSIMDYARFNYIAQPGDGVEYFLPPRMGPYDFYAIKWGYKPIQGVTKPEEEYATLNSWILEKSDDPVYRYGDQQLGAPNLDPSSQNEALGDDAILASTYGVNNLKVIMDHMVEWTVFANEDFSYMEHMLKEVNDQYQRYTGHVVSYIGGVYIYKPVGGEDRRHYTPVSENKQREALDWLFDELAIQHEWLLDSEIEKRIGSKKLDLMKEQAEQLDKMMNGAILQRLYMYHSAYTCQEYLDDLHRHMWKKTMAKKSLNEFERNLQATYVRNLLSMSGGITTTGHGSKNALSSISAPNGSKTPSATNIVDPLIAAKIREAHELLGKRLRQKDPTMEAHYRYLRALIENSEED